MAVRLSGTSITFNDNSVQTSDTSDSGGLINVTSHTGSGTYTAPTGTTRVFVKCTGGGGGSAGYLESGGASGYTEKMITGLHGGWTSAVTVGGGGGGVGYYGGGGVGGTSSFGAYCSATGGTGANNHWTHTGGHGGGATGGDLNIAGGSGCGHGNHHGSAGLGKGGSSYWGGAPARRHSGGELIGPGAPGGGGSGSPTDGGGAATGQPGVGGIVVVYAFR